jgi:hypothetical protein
LLLRPGLGFIKTICLMMAATGSAGLIFLQSKSLVTSEYLILFQAAILLLLLLQVLIIYASLRRAAAGKNESTAEDDAKPFGGPQKQPQQINLSFRGLPPSAVAVTLSVLFMLPIMADLGHQAKLAFDSRQLVENMNLAATNGDNVRIAVAPLSIRSGPSLGDDVLGVLPKGSRIHVHDSRSGWVNIGTNRWVPEKFLRPLVHGERASRSGSAKSQS